MDLPDCTHLLGTAREQEEELAFERFQAAHARNAERPNVVNARKLIEAYEAFVALFVEKGRK